MAMPTIVMYPHPFKYTGNPGGRLYPRLSACLHSAEGMPGVDIDFYLDTGAERSLFDGRLCRMLGIDLFSGEELEVATALGMSTSVRLHQVRLEHPALGSFRFVGSFSTGDVSRNLLGRDFLALVQIGFREAQQRFFVAPHP